MVDVNPVEKNSGIPTFHVDLAERRDVANSDRRAGRLDLAGNAGQPVFLSRRREPLRPEPLTGIDHGCTVAKGPVVPGRKPCRLEVSPAKPTGEGPDGDGKMRWTHDGCSNVLHRPTCQLGHDGVADDSTSLALVCRHPQRRISLEVLDSTEAFAPCYLDVCHGDIVLQVDERFSTPATDMPERTEACGLVMCTRHVQCGCLESAVFSRSCARVAARPQAS